MAKVMSKSELIQKIADQHADGMTRKNVKTVICEQRQRSILACSSGVGS
jgi:nucleoid DNA-binding protein